LGLAALASLGSTLAQSKDVATRFEAKDGDVAASVRVETLSGKPCPFSAVSYIWGVEMECPPSYIRELVVRRSGVNVFVPLSAFGDLANPTKVSVLLRGSPELTHIIVEGGDAATAYVATIKLKGKFIVGREVRSKQFPEDAKELTTYNWNQKR
jgi:hypothetical protein